MNTTTISTGVNLLSATKAADTTKNGTATVITVSIVDNGNKCVYAANGKILASISYRKEFDAYDVNTPEIGYMTTNVTEAHKACESGINWLLEQQGNKAEFNYTFPL